MDFGTRIAQPTDFVAVDALLRASYPSLMAGAYDANILAPALSLIARANPTLLASGTYYVAETADGSIIGCGGWTREHPGTTVSEPGIAHLRHFATHPDWTRRGVGRAIYTRCDAEARAAGITIFMCAASLNGEVFYRALGFERIAVIEATLTNDISIAAVRMRRSI